MVPPPEKHVTLINTEVPENVPGRPTDQPGARRQPCTGSDWSHISLFTDGDLSRRLLLTITLLRGGHGNDSSPADEGGGAGAQALPVGVKPGVEPRSEAPGSGNRMQTVGPWTVYEPTD